DVQRVGRAERLAQHVMNTGALQNCTDRTTGDHTGTRGGRTQQDHTCGLLTLDLVRDRSLDTGYSEEVLLRLLHALGDRGRHFLGLAVTNTDHAVAVTDDEQCGEGEATAALDDLRDPVDGHDLLGVGDTLVCGAAAAIPPLASGAAPRCCSHQCFLFSWLILQVTQVIDSELQSTLAAVLGAR